MLSFFIGFGKIMDRLHLRVSVCKIMIYKLRSLLMSNYNLTDKFIDHDLMNATTTGTEILKISSMVKELMLRVDERA
jgi:hypothetical protein